VIEAIDAGADDFVVKPIYEESLLARVGQARVALQRFRRFAELAETDPLTGVANRRRFHELCVREIARAARHGAPLSCLLLDIDFFKHFNDTYGHATGDKILRAVGEALLGNVRESDYVCRYGGDEFCVLLSDAGEAEAVAFAERLRARVAEVRVPAGKRPVGVQLTAGVALWRLDISTPRQLIDLADEALLAAKRAGRNRVLAYRSIGNVRDLDRADKQRDVRQLCRHIQAMAAALLGEAERWENCIPLDGDDSMAAAVNAAAKLQEQTLLALSQIRACFEPRSPVQPEVTPCSRSPAVCFQTNAFVKAALMLG
jgi:diguanylate cyclase (GGDEF)-like protein